MMMDGAKLQFVLRGFSHATGCRIFEFEGVAKDCPRLMFAVRADLGLARLHRIALQDLPVLCRSLLERCYAGDERRTFEFASEDMRLHAELAAAQVAAARVRRPPRRPVSPAAGAAWRGHQP